MRKRLIVDGKMLLGSNDAMRGNDLIRAHEPERSLADPEPQRFGGRVSDTTEDDDVAMAMARCGIAKTKEQG